MSSPPPPPPKDDNPKPRTPDASVSTFEQAQDKTEETPKLKVDTMASSPKRDNLVDLAEEKDNQSTDATDDSQSEIQSIMDQFEEGLGMGETEIMSPRLEKAGPFLSSPPTAFPPRRSSLAPIDSISPMISNTTNVDPEKASTMSGTSGLQDIDLLRKESIDGPKRKSHGEEELSEKIRRTSSEQPKAPSVNTQKPLPDKPLPEYTPSPRPPSITSAKQYKAPLPVPDPEPDLPFDFHRFLEQLRHRTADPVAKFLRSFLLEFGKKQWMVHEQVKIISDFLEFISKKMAQCEVWRTVSDAEFDNAREGMEKLVMNRLYTQCFSPAIPPAEPVAGSKRKQAQLAAASGRRGQHQEDVERDDVLAQKVQIYGWVKEEHLDIKPVGDKGRKFLKLAQQELLKVNSYRAPRDKVICVLNCCKVIFGFLRSAPGADQSADSFVPLLIYVVLQANPENLVSNVQYVLRFRNQEKLGGEAGYYISSLMGAIQFVEALDRTSLTVTDEEFEANVEKAVSAIAERHSAEERRHQLEASEDPGVSGQRLQPSPHLISEKSTLSRAEVTPRNSVDAERVQPSRSPSRRNGVRTEFRAPGEDDGEEDTAVAGLLRSIQKPLSTIGRIFSDDGGGGGSSATASNSSLYPGRAPATPQPPRRVSPNPQNPSPRLSAEGRSSVEQAAAAQNLLTTPPPPGQPPQQRMSAEDAAALQASAEVEQAQKLQRQEHQVVVETLMGMFPGLDREIIDDVVRAKEGRVGLAVDACLALSS